MTETKTDPPPDASDVALSRMSEELDEIGDVLAEQAAGLSELARQGHDDGHKLDRLLTALPKLDQIIGLLQAMDRRIGELETWRGDHERQHARQ